MGPIINVCSLEDYKLDIELNNGNRIILDFKQRLKTFRFHELSNYDVFKRVTTDEFSLIWKNGKIVVSFGEIIEMLQQQNVLFRAV